MWQFDFSEFVTATTGTWQLGAAVDYWAKPVLGCLVSTAKTAPDMIAALDTAVTAAETLIGMPLVDDCVDPSTGQVEALIVVTDNGPAMRSAAVAAWFARRPWMRHVRTRHRAPETNGVVERLFASLKYERLYRHDITDGTDLATHVDDFTDEYNQIRPHETIHWQRPLDRYLTTPEPSNPTPPRSCARNLTRDTSTASSAPG